MKNIFNKFDNDNSLDLLLRGNKVTESSHIVSFENSDDALDSLYEIYNESVNKFVEYKSAMYLENLVVNHMLYEKLDKEKAEVLLTESTEVKINQLNENLNQTISNIQSWIATLEVSTKDNNEWNHCIETSKRLTNFINNGCENEEHLLKVVKESLIGYKGMPWNKSVDNINIIEKGDKIMKNERVSKMIATKEATLNELKVIAESAELVNEVNEMQQSITNLKVKIFDNGGEMTQESYEMLMDLDVLEEGLKEKIKAAGEKRIDKKIAKKEAQIEKLRARMEKNGEGDPDNEELKEDIEIIKGEIEKLKEKIKKDGGECTQESYALLESIDVLEEGLREKFAAKLSGVKDKRASKKIGKKVIQIEKIKAKIEKEKEEHAGNMEEFKEDLKACEEKGDEKGAAKIRKRMEKEDENFKFYVEEMEEDIKIIEGEIEKLRGKVKEADGEMTQEAYAILESLDVLEEGLKEKMAAKMSGIKDKRVAKKIAKKEAQIEKIKARMEKEKDFHKNTVEELEADIEYCNEKGDEKGKAKIEKKLAKEKEEHAYDIEEMEEDIKTIEGEIEKLKSKVKEAGGEMTQEAYEILMDLDVLEEGLKAKVKAIGDKKLNKKLAKRENLLGKMKQMLLDVEDEGHKEKIQSDILDLESDIEKIKSKLEKNVDEVVQESYLEVVFEHNGYDMIDEYDYLDEGLREKIRGMKDDHLVKKVDKKEAKLAEKKAQLGEMETPEDDKKKAKVEKEIEKLEKEIERLKGKIKSEPGENIVEGQCESTELDGLGFELLVLESMVEEFEALLAEKQQVLNENYSYRNDIEVEILEEGLKDLGVKIDNKINDAILKYKKPDALKRIIEREQDFIDEAKACLEERDQEKGAKKFFKVVGRSVVYGMMGSALTPRVSLGANPAKVIRKYIASAERFIAAANRRLAKLEGEGKQEEAPAQESTNYKSVFKDVLDTIDFED